LRLLVQGIGEPVVADEPGQHDLLLAGLAGDRAAGGVVLARLGAGIAVRVVAELAQFPCAEDLADAGLDPSVFLGIPVPTLYRWRRYRAAGRPVTGSAVTCAICRMRSSPGSGSSHDRGRITFGDYAEAWLESRADLKPKTRRQYQSLMRLHIMPTWRTVPLAKITFEDLTQWVARLSLAGLGPSGVRQMTARTRKTGIRMRKD
jgi:Phage integrase, N-terminal SAM-like domain